MRKLFILAIISLSLLSSCSFNNPLSKKAKLAYVDCPKSLILAPGKSSIKDNINISLKKDYLITCYYIEDQENEIIFDFKYELDIDASNSESNLINFEFWVFLTNKEESEKILENKFNQFLDLSQRVEDNINPLEFVNTVNVKRSDYDQGLKIFISLN